MAKVIALGGIFFLCDDPAALAAWYQENLGVDIDESYGGASFMPAAMPAGGYSLWSPFKSDSDYFKPSKQRFMVNFIVDDLGALVAQLRSSGVTLVGEPESGEFGEFAWLLDPAGNKVELWQPSSV